MEYEQKACSTIPYKRKLLAVMVNSMCQLKGVLDKINIQISELCVSRLHHVFVLILSVEGFNRKTSTKKELPQARKNSPKDCLRLHVHYWLSSCVFRMPAFGLELHHQFSCVSSLVACIADLNLPVATITALILYNQ